MCALFSCVVCANRSSPKQAQFKFILCSQLKCAESNAACEFERNIIHAVLPAQSDTNRFFKQRSWKKTNTNYISNTIGSESSSTNCSALHWHSSAKVNATIAHMESTEATEGACKWLRSAFWPSLCRLILCFGAHIIFNLCKSKQINLIHKIINWIYHSSLHRQLITMNCITHHNIIDHPTRTSHIYL